MNKMEETDNIQSADNSEEVDTIERKIQPLKKADPKIRCLEAGLQTKKPKKSTKTEEEIYQTRLESQKKAVETRKAQSAAKKELLSRVAEAESQLTVEKLAVKTQKRMKTQNVNDELVRRLDDLTKQLEEMRPVKTASYKNEKLPAARPTEVHEKQQRVKEVLREKRPAEVPQQRPASTQQKYNLSSMGF